MTRAAPTTSTRCFTRAAVVGLNTSALVEAAIVDRPVFTILLPEFRENQEGTFHFHHLLTVGRRVPHVLAFARRARRAAGSAVSAARTVAPNRPFVEQFIRPRRRRGGGDAGVRRRRRGGWRATAPRRDRRRSGLLLLRPVVYALVLAGRVPLLERIYWNPEKAAQSGHS